MSTCEIEVFKAPFTEAARAHAVTVLGEALVEHMEEFERARVIHGNGLEFAQPEPSEIASFIEDWIIT